MLWRPLAMVDRQYADERDDRAMVNFVARMMPGAVKLSMVRRPMTARRCPGAWYVACYVIGQTDWDHADWDQADWDQAYWDQAYWDQADWGHRLGRPKGAA
jgi:hypothetical protein